VARFLELSFTESPRFHLIRDFRKKLSSQMRYFMRKFGFYGAEFEDNADFEHVYFDRDAIFTQSKFKKDFYLSESRIKIMNLDDVEFGSESNIWLVGSYYDRLVEIRWNTLKDHLDPNNEAVFLSFVES